MQNIQFINPKSFEQLPLVEAHENGANLNFCSANKGYLELDNSRACFTRRSQDCISGRIANFKNWRQFLFHIDPNNDSQIAETLEAMGKWIQKEQNLKHSSLRAFIGAGFNFKENSVALFESVKEKLKNHKIPTSYYALQTDPPEKHKALAQDTVDKEQCAFIKAMDLFFDKERVFVSSYRIIGNVLHKLIIQYAPHLFFKEPLALSNNLSRLLAESYEKKFQTLNTSSEKQKKLLAAAEMMNFMPATDSEFSLENTIDTSEDLTTEFTERKLAEGDSLTVPKA